MTNFGGVVRRRSVVVGRLLLCALPFAASFAPRALALGGNDTTGCYAFSDSIAPLDANAPAVSFVDISATGAQLLLGDDQVSAAIPLGFDFNFYGVAGLAPSSAAT